MADTQTTVANLDIQLLDASRSNATTIKLDNPKTDPAVTREQVSAAMQQALTNGWLLTTKGDVVTYLGDITYNTSIKTKLGGNDFYITPNKLTLSKASQTTGTKQYNINVTGAIIQGYNIPQTGEFDSEFVTAISGNPVINNNGLTLSIYIIMTELQAVTNGNYTIQLIIQGTIINYTLEVTD